MAHSSDDNSDEELPNVQLLLEQEVAKSKKERIALPPSLFDPVVRPKLKLGPKSQLTKSSTTTKPKIVGKKKAVVTETLGDGNVPRAPKEVRAGKDAGAKRQIRKPVTEKAIKVAVGAFSTTLSPLVPLDHSDHFSAAGNAGKITQPTTQRRRRLVQKKYLTSDDDDDDDDDDDSDDNNEAGKEQEREVSKMLQGAVVDLTYSDSEEELPLARRPGVRVRAISGDEGLESCGSGGIHGSICGAILTYSPPRSSKPRKILLPGVSFDKPARGRKLSSPEKNTQIPASEHHSNSDEFWDQGTTNNWIDTHTPHKTLNIARTPLNTADDISEVPSGGDSEESEEEKRPVTSKTSSKKVALTGSEGAAGSKKAFNARKKQLAEEFLRKVDDKISGGEVARKTASTGGVKITWSKTLRTTAGTAKWRMEKLQTASGQVSLGDPTSSDGVRHHATIDLSEKVVDCEEKLYNVLCHEYCHLANYIISNVRKPPHGASFKKWASLCTRTFSNLNVHVTTTHSYEIESKYKWACQTCGYVYKRHSQSIDIARHTCGACKGGKLVQTHPPPKEKRPITGYQAFMKENFGRIKAENPGTPQRDIMSIVAGAYRAAKASGDQEKAAFVEVNRKEGNLEDMFVSLKV